MLIRKIINTTVVMLGIIALVIGMIGIFESNVAEQSPWVFTILGTVFFSWSMALLKAFDRDENELSS